MEIAFYYGSIVVCWILLIIITFKRRLNYRHFIIGIATVAYSLTYEILLGDQAALYYYINPKRSTFYIVMAAILLYPVINIIYVLFLPEKQSQILLYSFCWILLMHIFEYSSILSKTIVLTGWKILPWSLFTYIVTFLWVFLLNRRLKVLITV